MNNNETFIDKIFFIIFRLIAIIFFGFFRLLFKGLRVAQGNNIALITFIALGILIVFSVLVDAFVEVLFLSCMVIIIFGIWQHIKEIPYKKTVKYYNYIFTKSGLVSKEGYSPYYLDTEELNEYTTILTFYNEIPLSEWQKKEEALKHHLSKKIIDIVLDEQDTRYMYLLVEKKPSQLI